MTPTSLFMTTPAKDLCSALKKLAAFTSKHQSHLGYLRDSLLRHMAGGDRVQHGAMVEQQGRQCASFDPHQTVRQRSTWWRVL